MKLLQNCLAALQFLFGLACLMQTYRPEDIWSNHTYNVLASLMYAATIINLLARPKTKTYAYFTLFNSAWLVFALLFVDDTFVTKIRHITNVQGYTTTVGALMFSVL